LRKCTGQAWERLRSAIRPGTVQAEGGSWAVKCRNCTTAARTQLDPRRLGRAVVPKRRLNSHRFCY
jgi:hypothetical protein